MKLKAYWLRYWHCFFEMMKVLRTQNVQDHRAYTEYVNRTTTYIGCCCGKSYFGMRTISDEKFNNRENWPVKK